ncbi:MAG: hypothetical protein IMZ47_05970 [Firmicutes bacterium]|nr:hypothetical protein [Bacillota bacterium]
MATCEYFGVRTPNRDRTAQCKNCKAFHLDEFKLCTKESNILMATSIDVDKQGHIVAIPPVGPISDMVLIAEDWGLVPEEAAEEEE